MDDTTKVHFKTIAQSLNSYVKSKDLKHTHEIEEQLKKLFGSEYVHFWKYNRNEEKLHLLGEPHAKSIHSDTSLTKQAIDSKSAKLVNHITSDRYYNPEVDNPLDLKIKAVMISPIVRGKEVRGVLKICRGLKQRKVFTKHDESTLEALSPLFLKLIMGEMIEKKELIEILGEGVHELPEPKESTTPKAKKRVSKPDTPPTQHNTPIKAKPKKTPPPVTPVKKTPATQTQKTPEKPEVSKKILEAKFEQEKRLLEKKFQREIEKYQKSELTLKQEIKQGEDRLEKITQKCKTLETNSDAFINSIEQYQLDLKKYETELGTLKEENSALKAFKNSKSIQELKSEHSLYTQHDAYNIDENIESILQKVDERFAENEYAYMLYEILTYAMNSKKGLTQIEDFIRKSKLLPRVIEEYAFHSDIDMHTEKHILSKMVSSIQRYAQTVFGGQPDLNIEIAEDMPVSLVFDRAKIQSIIVHLLIDLYQFIDHHHPITIDLRFDSKFLVVDMGGFIDNQNSLFKFMFKKTKLSGDEKDRLGLQLSRRLIKRLKGNMEIGYEDEYYRFTLMFPVQLIKM